MPADTPITASNLLSAGWRRADGAADRFTVRLGDRLTLELVQVMGGSWRPIVQRDWEERHHLMSGMAEVYALIDQLKRIDNPNPLGPAG